MDDIGGVRLARFAAQARLGGQGGVGRKTRRRNRAVRLALLACLVFTRGRPDGGPHRDAGLGHRRGCRSWRLGNLWLAGELGLDIRDGIGCCEEMEVLMLAAQWVLRVASDHF